MTKMAKKKTCIDTMILTCPPKFCQPRSQGGPPRMKRPPAPAVLDEEERRQKMDEIDTLEVQLKEAQTCQPPHQLRMASWIILEDHET